MAQLARWLVIGCALVAPWTAPARADEPLALDEGQRLKENKGVGTFCLNKQSVPTLCFFGVRLLLGQDLRVTYDPSGKVTAIHTPADTMRPRLWAHLLDLFEEALFPWPKAEEDISVSLSGRTNGAEYLERLHESLPTALNRHRPDLVVYNAGSDVLWSDPLSHLRLTAEEMAERDLYVVSEVQCVYLP